MIHRTKFHLFFTLIFCIAAMQAVAAGDRAKEKAATKKNTSFQIVPLGWHYPFPHRPMVIPGQTDIGQTLHIAGQNQVFHHVELDRTPLKWAGKLLRIDVGFPEPWTPENRFELFPQGIKAYPKGAAAFLSRTMILFASMPSTETFDPVRSTNHPEYTLRRYGEYFAVTEGAERRWYFESIDEGKSWRLKKLESVQQPGQFTVLTYEGDKIATIQLPNAFEIKLKYNNGYPVEVALPFNEVVQIKRDAQNHVREITFIRKRALAGRDAVARQYQYQCDAQGRIQRFINEFGVAFTVRYSENKVDANNITYQAMVINEGDETYEFRRHEFVRGSESIYTDGFGTPGSNPGSATASGSGGAARGAAGRSTAATRAIGGGGSDGPVVTSQVKTKKVEHTYALVSRSDGDPSTEVNYELDARGKPRTRIDPTGRVSVFQYDALGRPVTEILPGPPPTEPSPEAAQESTPESSPETPSTTPAENPAAAPADGAAAAAQAATENAGKSNTDPSADAPAKAATAPANASGKTAGEAGGTSGDTSRGTSIAISGGVRRKFTEFAPTGQLLREIDPDGGETVLMYDEADRLVSKMTPEGMITAYEYDHLGLISQTTFNDETHLFKVDDWGRITEHLWPHGTRMVFRFDDYNQVTDMEIRQRPPEVAAESPPAAPAEAPSATPPQVAPEAPAEVAPKATPAVQPEDRLLGARNFTYRPSGELAVITYEDKRTERFIYDDNRRLILHTEPDGNRIAYRYNKAGRVEHRANPKVAVENFVYNPVGKIIEHHATRAGGDRSRQEYDAHGRLVKEMIAGQGIHQYEYDVVGRRNRIIHPDGTDTRYAFDTLDRIIKVRGSRQPAVDYVYDAQGNRTEVEPKELAEEQPAPEAAEAAGEGKP